MEKDEALSSMIHEIKRGNGKRWLYMAAVLLVFAGIMAVVIVGFKGRRIQKNAEAISAPLAKPSPNAWRP
jgi:uncharacterized membrane protein